MQIRKLVAALVLVATPLFGELPPSVGEDKTLAVQGGQNLYEVAREQKLALEHLTFANNLPLSYEAPQSENLRLPHRHILPRQRPDTGLVVNVPERGVYVFRDKKFVGFFPVAIGKKGYETPTGRFQILNKVKNPTWIPPEWAKEEKPVPPGPKNPLGDRWIGLSAPGIGIHATNEPASVGGALSHGCMRTYPEVAAELFDLVEPKMPAWIVYEPVKLGRDADGELLVQSFGDVYERNNRGTLLRQLIEQEGLELSQAAQSRILQKSDGVTRSVDALVSHVWLDDAAEAAREEALNR
jgi:L,D-transpeptidase ErfK/SrfK